MSTQEESRKAMAENRQHQEHIRENMLNRSQAEIEQSSNAKIEEEARETMVKNRQHDQNMRQNMLSRSDAEINPKAK